MYSKKAKVLIGTPSYTAQCSIEFAISMGMYLSRFTKNHPDIEFAWIGVPRTFVHTARNIIADIGFNQGFTHVWWVDDDCILPEDKDNKIDILYRLLSHDVDIVITPYFLRAPKQGHACGVLRSPDLDDPKQYYNLKTTDLHKGLVEVDGGGTHCMLCKIDTFVRVDAPPFALPVQGGTEDMYFCVHAKKAGIKIYCDTDIEVGHIGYSPIITHKDADKYEREQEEQCKIDKVI